MSADESTILQDQRQIDSIHFNDERECFFSIAGGFKIEAYGEPALHCDMPYFRVTKGDEIVARIPAYMVSVHYVVPS